MTFTSLASLESSFLYMYFSIFVKNLTWQIFCPWVLLPNFTPIGTHQIEVAEIELRHLKLMNWWNFIDGIYNVFRGDADILTLDFPKQIENEDQIVQIFEDAAIR